MSESSDLSCTAKLVRVVLANCGPLSPSEVAEEACIDRGAASQALAELEDRGRVASVCGVCSTKETVYELQEATAEP
ncbi:MAG: hypothetical protein ABEJ68_07610 [Halobacteriaceae archaeon]